MKKTLLTLAAALSVAGSAFAQISGPWTGVSLGTVLPANYIETKIKVVNPAVIWALAEENVTGSLTRSYIRSVDGGNTWTGGSIAGLPAGLNVSSITAIDANTAWIAASPTASGSAGQGVYKTTDGGVTWTRQASASYSGGDAFINSVYFWDANNGVALGDANPHSVGSRLEIYTTSNGGTTWTRNTTTAPAVQNLSEYGNAGSFFALGNTIWYGGASDDGNGVGQGARLYKSTDRGLTWTAASTDLTNAVSQVAFIDAQRGILSEGLDIATTSNGGQTNSLAAYTGNFRAWGLDAIPGTTNGYISVGTSIPSPTNLQSVGSSISRDGGQTWTDLNTNVFMFAVDMYSNAVGYVGGIVPTTSTTNAPIWRLSSVLSSKSAQLAKGALQVFPNPSTSGVFTLNLNLPGSKASEVTVTDALGRQVYHTNLNATSVGQNVSLDLSKQAAGLYTLRLETEQGTAVEKLVIQ